MKTLVTISLFIFWAVVVAIIVASLLFYQNNRAGLNGGFKLAFINNGATNSNGGSVASQAPSTDTNENGPLTLASQGVGVSSTLSLTEIGKHNSRGDCWLLINNNVYNVTSYISVHPGGVGEIIPYCGKEATQAFNTQNNGRPHSNKAAGMLTDYYIGNLNQATSQQQVQQSVQTTNAVTPKTRGEDDD